VASLEIDAATLAVLAAADGSTPLRDLAPRPSTPSTPSTDLIMRLWSDRYLDLRPAT
jgi:hypothetical protein